MCEVMVGGSKCPCMGVASSIGPDKYAVEDESKPIPLDRCPLACKCAAAEEYDLCRHPSAVLDRIGLVFDYVKNGIVMCTDFEDRGSCCMFDGKTIRRAIQLDCRCIIMYESAYEFIEDLIYRRKNNRKG